MANETLTTEAKLVGLKEKLYQEWVQLQIVGRMLTAEEQARAEALARAVQLLNEVLTTLGVETGEEAGPDTVIKLRDGAYTASSDRYIADLRIDISNAGILSMDMFRSGGRSRRYLASIRTDPGATLRAGQRKFGVIGQDGQGNHSSGLLEITPVSKTQASLSLTMSQSLNSLPVNTPLVLAARWQRDALRTLGLEVEREKDVAELPHYEHEGRVITLESCFADAGFEIFSAGAHDDIPRPDAGWDDSQLHGLMKQFADESLDRRSWILHLLLLSQARDPLLYGVMFDSGLQDSNGLPRQGAAVFANPMRNHAAGFERKILQTTVHELGHALNLAHRFEQAVSRADSTSFMNYDWRYLGGNRTWQYWRNFAFKFDEDELRFLQHGPWPHVIPGGSEFHTVPYWSEGGGGYSPYLPEIRDVSLALRLQPPAAGPVFEFAQPVLLTVELVNDSNERLDIPRFYLDPKSGFLQLVTRRISGGAPNGGDARAFRPLMTRCYDVGSGAADVLGPGQGMSDNVNLTFGSAGFTFAEPGNYEVTAVLWIPDWDREVAYVIESAPLQIRIGYPKTLDDERDAMEIFTKDVGYFFVLGGSDALPRAADTLEDIRARRQGKKAAITDPLVAYISRCQAINMAREFIEYRAGAFKTRAAKIEKAASLLDGVAKATKLFDPATLAGTRALAAVLNKKLK